MPDENRTTKKPPRMTLADAKSVVLHMPGGEQRAALWAALDLLEEMLDAKS